MIRVPPPVNTSLTFDGGHHFGDVWVEIWLTCSETDGLGRDLLDDDVPVLLADKLTDEEVAELNLREGYYATPDWQVV